MGKDRQINGYSIKGKSYVVYGAARSGFSAADLIGRHGGAVILIDDAPEIDGDRMLIAEKLIADGMKLMLEPGMDIIRELTRDADALILSPGIPLSMELRDICAGTDCEILGELELGARLCPCPIIAVSGSNGKTTTACLCYECLLAAGRRAHLVGNVGSSFTADKASGYTIGDREVLFTGEVGVPFCERIDAIKPDDIVVSEVSSYQLETTSTFQPHIAVLVNIVEDHLARHGDMGSYVATKGRIFARQDTNDYAILNADDPLVGEAYESGGGSARTLSFSSTNEDNDAYYRDGAVFIKVDKQPALLVKRDEFNPPGDHNIENLMAAALATRAAGAGLDEIRSVARTFRGVEHRIEWVGEFGGIEVYNDSKGTNPDSTIKALSAFERPVILILGGYEKGSDFTPLYEVMPEKVRHTLIVGANGERLDRELGTRGYKERTVVGDLDRALKWMRANGQEGDVLLLSPASASFDRYESYEERGKVFKKLTKEILAGK